jgi:hypothetical protein
LFVPASVPAHLLPHSNASSTRFDVVKATNNKTLTDLYFLSRLTEITT